ncbi:hypothetical protein [uncultured Sphingomonas sp.]|uniref:hypothetical protein n=1 Tax=uncultured Sphingomonas sp. TaxID=158754 RepID=UPI0035CA7138
MHLKTVKLHLSAMLAAVAAAAIGSSAHAADPYVPARGGAARAAIMDAIRRGTQSDSVFIVDYLEVASDEDTKFAFAEVHPASASGIKGFHGWVILNREVGEKWITLWGVDYDGHDYCRILNDNYQDAVEAASRYNTSMTLFSPSFRRQLSASFTNDDYGTCRGKVIISISKR